MIEKVIKEIYMNQLKKVISPKWTMYVQIMTEDQANSMPYNPFDLTKVWYKSEYPLIKVGILELNKNPDNYFQDVEQSAFNPASVVPGISFSPDRMLPGKTICIWRCTTL